jgi:phage baseplate assembly protein W
MSIYKGVGFSFDSDETGIPPVKIDLDLLGDSITQILMTGKGERVCRPDFGSFLQRIVFENVGSSGLVGRIKDEIVSSIKQWEPRVAVEASDIVVEISGSQVTITVNYKFMDQTGQVIQTIQTITS